VRSPPNHDESGSRAEGPAADRRPLPAPASRSC